MGIVSVWQTNGMGIKFSDPELTPFPTEKEINDIQDAVYFYYTVEVFKGEEVVFSTRTHDFPKVHELAAGIDELLDFDMEKALKIDECNDNGIHRYTRLAIKTIQDWCEMEYSVRLEREEYFVQQTEHEGSVTGESFVATVSDHTKGRLVPSYTFSGLERKDLLRLQKTSLDFCQKALKLYQEKLQNDETENKSN